MSLDPRTQNYQRRWLQALGRIPHVQEQHRIARQVQEEDARKVNAVIVEGKCRDVKET